MDRLVVEDAPLPRPREQVTPTRPSGKLTFDWDMVLAIRRQVDTPDPEWLERLSEITAETLVVAGGPASHVPQAGLAEMARRIPQGRLVTIPAGHLIHNAEPMAFVEVVTRFLRPLGEPDDHPLPAGAPKPGRPGPGRPPGSNNSDPV